MNIPNYVKIIVGFLLVEDIDFDTEVVSKVIGDLNRAGGRTPRTPRSGGGASHMLRGLMLHRRAVLGTPKCEKSVGRPQTP